MKTLYGIAVAVLVLVAVAGAYAVSPRALEPVERPDPQSFDQETVARGERLAMIGNCADCHTAEGGEPYAGGRAIPTPLGTIHGTNITPAEETGIGTWSAEAFRRAMYHGLDREGNHLYPAFPYHHFTKVAEEDIDSIYAYLMTLEPVENEIPANALAFPFNIRPLLAGWKLLYLKDERFAGLPDASEEVNRGAYLVQGLGHCGGCHTPRNFLQAEKEDQFLRGEITENWYAPAIAGDVPAASAWDQERLTTYLRHGWTAGHGIPIGPMSPVSRNLSRVPAEDVSAISAYLATLIENNAQAQAQVEKIRAANGAEETADGDTGAAIYANACAGCHEAEPERFAQGLQLAYSTSLRIPDPRNLIHIIEEGVQPREGEPGFYMPGFAGALRREQMTALVSYLRERFTELDPWEDLEGTVAEVMDARADQASASE